MSGLPDRGPCGWGYSYMDVTAGWYVALNTMAALRHRSLTGQGHHLDTAQTDVAVYHSVVVWCRAFGVLITWADLGAA